MNTRMNKQAGKRYTARNPSALLRSSRNKTASECIKSFRTHRSGFPRQPHYLAACHLGSMRHTVVISDIHLCEVEPGSGEWMRYRQRASIPDAEIGKMLEDLCETVGEEPLTLVLNGDIFDFDAPRVVDGSSQYHDLPRTAEHSVPA
ncbi:MAG TPA: hypothetical protein PKA58_37345, partial [Polyangium sp.]|nr:hypothetical protein [Polyangium sp.]